MSKFGRKVDEYTLEILFTVLQVPGEPHAPYGVLASCGGIVGKGYDVDLAKAKQNAVTALIRRESRRNNRGVGTT